MASSLTNILLAVLVLFVILTRQVRAQPAREDRGILRMVVIGAIGAYEILQFGEHNTVPVAAYALLVLGLVVGAALGVVRGFQVHLWRNEAGVLMRQGNVVTVVLWLVAIGIHVGLDYVGGDVSSSAAGLNSASILLYIAVSFGVQRLVIMERAQRMTSDDLVVGSVVRG